MNARDKLAETIDSTIGHERHHTGPVDDSAPGGCGDCYALAKRVADGLIAAGFGDVREARAEAWAEGWAHYRKFYNPHFVEFGNNPYRAALTATEAAE